jgi:hypothetical protein
MASKNCYQDSNAKCDSHVREAAIHYYSDASKEAQKETVPIHR